MASSITRAHGGMGGRFIQGDFSAIGRMSQQLSRLAIGNQEAILAAGMDKATSKIANDARARAPKDDGDLKKSLGNKVKTYRDGAVVLGLIGPRKGAFASGEGGKRVKIRRNKGESGREYNKRTKGEKKPSQYAHLVEFGHRSVHGGGSLPNYGGKVKGVWNKVNAGKSIRAGTVSATSFVAPRPFLRPAFNGGISNLETTLADVTKQAMEAEFKKVR